MKHFQPTALSIALAGLFAVPAAHALDIARTTTAITNGQVIYTAGATAPTKLVWKAFRNLCAINATAGDTFDVYKAGTTGALFDPGDTGFGNQFAFSCKLKTSGVPTALSGVDFAYMVGVADGSFSSVRGMTTTASLQQQHVISTLAGCSTSGVTVNSDGDNTYPSCSTERKQSVGGFSDVEQQLFDDLFPTGGVTAAQVKVDAAAVGQVFGLAVSELLYRGLQTAQGLSTGCTDDLGAFSTAPTVVGLNDRDPVCQPSINRIEFASILSNSKTAAPKLAGTGWGFMGVAGNPAVTLCRRVDLSGTQASANAYFLDRPCARFGKRTGNLVPGGSGTAGNAAVATMFVRTNSGSSQLRTCLNLGEVSTGTVSGAAIANDYRIGILSAENTPEATDKWNFIKLDGVAVNQNASGGLDTTSKLSTIQGKYGFAYELVLHTNNSTTVTPAAAAALLQQIRNDIANPGLTDLRGVYQVPSTTFPHTSNPTKVAKISRGGNSCQPFSF